MSSCFRKSSLQFEGEESGEEDNSDGEDQVMQHGSFLSFMPDFVPKVLEGVPLILVCDIMPEHLPTMSFPQTFFRRFGCRLARIFSAFGFRQVQPPFRV